MSYYFYDSAGRLSQLANRGPSYSTVISYFAYGRDANGNITSITRESTCPAGNNVYYTYDALDRLTVEEHKTGTTVFYGYQYNHDAASNRYFKYDYSAGVSPVVTTYWTFDSRNILTEEWKVQ